MEQDPNDPARENSSSRCPVNRQDASSNSEESTSVWSSVLSVFSAVKKPPMVGSPIEDASRYGQSQQPDQRVVLATERQTSSIPRGNQTVSPPHQPPQTMPISRGVGSSAKSMNDDHGNSTSDNSNNWVYPSEQQLYNAMRRKGWSNVPEDSIPIVLQIHNSINERTWRQIQEWEGSNQIKLVRFLGRPRDLSPKALINSYILRLRDPPFDRHDWYVETPSGYEQRYVIDYYMLKPTDPALPPYPYIDARPALDHPRAVLLRTKFFLRYAFPGITNKIKQLTDKKAE